MPASVPSGSALSVCFVDGCRDGRTALASLRCRGQSEQREQQVGGTPKDQVRIKGHQYDRAGQCGRSGNASDSPHIAWRRASRTACRMATTTKITYAINNGSPPTQSSQV